MRCTVALAARLKELLSNVVYGPLLSGDLVFPDSINETNVFDNLSKSAISPQPPPALRQSWKTIVSIVFLGSLESWPPQLHRGKRRLDGVGRPEMRPVLSRKVVESGSSSLSLARLAVAKLQLVGQDELIEGLVGFLTGLRFQIWCKAFLAFGCTAFGKQLRTLPVL